MTSVRDRLRSHEVAIELIPWLVNGRLPPTDAAWLERHVEQCKTCRQEVAAQRAIRLAVRHDASNIEHAPHAALQKLWARIDPSAEAPPGAGRKVRASPSVTPAPVREVARWRGARWQVAAAAILAVGVGLVAAASWRGRVPGFAPDYRTASVPEPMPDRAGQIRAVFVPTVTIEDLTQIVSAANLKIIDGPSGAGVYTLAMQAGQARSTGDVLARLRGDPRVRLAEPVVAESPGPP